MYIIFFFLLYLLRAEVSGEGNCGHGKIESAQVDPEAENPTRCVDIIAFLVGGSNLGGWRRDAELLGNNDFHAMVADYPYSIDAPYGFWAGPKLGLVLCGGKNWDSDVVERRCWRYRSCLDQWDHITDMPVGSSGGSAVALQNVDGSWSLWVIGGGNGTSATNDIQILTGRMEENGEESWSWRVGPQLHQGRYGHCAVWHLQSKQIIIIGGRNNDDILRTMEAVDPGTETIQVEESWETPVPRWGGICQYIQDGNGNAKIAVMGGMDLTFIPHSNLHFVRLGNETEEGADLPWSAAGPIGVAINGSPTIIGGFSLLGFQNRVASLQQGEWHVWDSRLTSSRVSGLAVQVPEDILDYC